MYTQINGFKPFLRFAARHRSLHTSNCLFSVPRQARFLKKLMTGSNRSRKKFYTVDQPVSKSFQEIGMMRAPGATGKPAKSHKCIRRVEVLNTLFMEQITSLMSTGETSHDLVGLGIAISAVKVSNDFSRVNVYWVASGTEHDEIIEPILRKTAGILRHELTQLRVIGMVPPIEFVKDKTISKIMEVETLLQKCDFGEDFVPTASKHLFSQSNAIEKTEKSTLEDFSTEIPKNPDNATIQTSEIKPEEITSEAELYKYTTIRQDMLGVRHDVIMGEIREMMSKIKNKKISMNEEYETRSENEFNKNLGVTEVEKSESLIVGKHSEFIELTKTEVIEDKKRKQDFFKYLRKQQLSQSVLLKQQSTSAKEKEFYDDEAYERWKTKVFGNELEDDFDDKDVYEDHDEIYLKSDYENKS